MNFWQKSIYLVLISVTIFSLLRYFAWWIDPKHVPNNWTRIDLHTLDFLIFGLLTFVVFISSLNNIGVWFAMWFMANPRQRPITLNYKVAFLTCFVPGKEPLDMLENTLRAMVKVRYPHDTWLLDEGNSSEVKELCARLGVNHFSRKGVGKYNQSSGKFRSKTKAGNHNAWLDKYENNYDIVAQIDMDHVPEPDFLEKTLGYFSDPKVGIICSPQKYKNTENWIAKGSDEQANLFHGPIQQGYYGADMPFLIGTSHIYRTKAMKDIGGYAPTIVEDHLTGMLFYSKGWKGVFVPLILAKGDGPTTWSDYFNQQMRWSYGLFEILFKHTPNLFFKLNWKQRLNYLSAQLYYFTGVSVLIGTFLTFLYLVFGINAANMKIETWIWYALPPFIFDLLIQVYVHRFTIDPKREPIFGLFGMFLNLGANLIYTLAFVKFLTQSKLQYMVTKKGSAANDESVNLDTFTPHLIVVGLMLLALAASFTFGNQSLPLRLWAVFSVISLSSVIFSNYLVKTYRQVNNYLDISLYFRYTVAVAVFLLVIWGLGRWNITQGGINVPGSGKSVVINNVQNFPKILTSGALVGISMPEDEFGTGLYDLQQTIDKNFALVGFYQAWGGKNRNFNAVKIEEINSNGSIPLITWEPWEPIEGYDRSLDEVDNSKYYSKNIINGNFDGYITNYAKDVKNYGKPIMIRFAHEMNGNWYPWGSTFNSPSEYIMAWRHVHQIFEQVGAKNVAWVWSPNEEYQEERVPFANNIEVFYPGDDYVDWVGVSSFNWAGRYKQNIWRDPENLFGETVAKLRQYDKPIIIAETASSEDFTGTSSKAQWIADLAFYVRNNPEIKGLVWFNMQDNGIDWTIKSSLAALNSFKYSFSDDYFLSSLDIINGNLVRK